MAQVVSRRPLTAEARFRARANPCGICGGQSGTGTGFSPSSSVFPCQYIIPPSFSKLISSGECVIFFFNLGLFLTTEVFPQPFRFSWSHTIDTYDRTPLDEWPARSRGLYLHRTTRHRNTRDKHPCPQRDSNTRPQQPSGRRPTP
jgi:hypothetical protein